MKIIVSDSGPLIILTKIGRIELLKNFFSNVLVTPIVFEEITQKNDAAKKLLEHSDFIKVTDITNSKDYNTLLNLLDAGEASSIALAKEQNTILLIDVKKGRKVAKSMPYPSLVF